MICMYLTNDWLLFAFAPREGGVDSEELRCAVRGLGMSNVCHAVGRDMVEGEEQSNDESIGTTGMMIHRQPGLHLAPPGPCGPVLRDWSCALSRLSSFLLLYQHRNMPASSFKLNNGVEIPAVGLGERFVLGVFSSPEER